MIKNTLKEYDCGNLFFAKINQFKKVKSRQTSYVPIFSLIHVKNKKTAFMLHINFIFLFKKLNLDVQNIR